MCVWGGTAIYNWLSLTPSLLLPSSLQPFTGPNLYATASPSLPLQLLAAGWFLPEGVASCPSPLLSPPALPSSPSTENKHNREPRGVFFITRSETVFGNFSSFSLKQVQTRTTRSKVQFRLCFFLGEGVFFFSSVFFSSSSVHPSALIVVVTFNYSDGGDGNLVRPDACTKKRLKGGGGLGRELGGR